MARRKRSKSRIDIESDVLYSIGGVLCIGIALFLILSALSLAGPVGSRLFGALHTLFGGGYYLLPTLAIALGILLFRGITARPVGPIKWIAAAIILLSGLGLLSLIAPTHGGSIGSWIAAAATKLFDLYGSVVLLAALFIAATMTLLEIRLSLERMLFWRNRSEAEEDEEDYEETEPLITGTTSEEDEEETSTEREPAAVEEPIIEEHSALGALFSRKTSRHETYTPPPLKLLEKDRGRPGAGDVKANANIIRRTLANFGITVEVEEVTVGPTVTQYALKPAEGVRLSRIFSLQNNLELALAAHPVRIEAPIPGKSLVGVEVPNTSKTTVGLGTLLSSGTFKNALAPLFFALGRNVAGATYGSDLGRMPHLLIAGATGSGKSVAIHTLITSLLYRNGPDALKFILVDPKRVELTLYNGIPHLFTPVITDAKRAILALKWLITEMERRYDILEQESVRDVASYHTTVLTPALKKADKSGDSDTPPDSMPYIVVIIDELADIMSAYPRELEAAIVRLAQMSRAVGIHLVLSTQRPSVNVITGLIKANVPARIALQVASQIDSRTILDMAGAEKLLGSGDMLFISAEMSKPVRLQGGFISEQEVKRVVEYLEKHYEADTEDIELATDTGGDNSLGGDSFDDEEDELYEDAYETVIAAGKASTSYLQRKLRVGYARAARLIDMLEDRGVIGPADGSKPRDVLSTDHSDATEDD